MIILCLLIDENIFNNRNVNLKTLKHFYRNTCSLCLNLTHFMQNMLRWEVVTGRVFLSLYYFEPYLKDHMDWSLP